MKISEVKFFNNPMRLIIFGVFIAFLSDYIHSGLNLKTIGNFLFLLGWGMVAVGILTNMLSTFGDLFSWFKDKF